MAAWMAFNTLFPPKRPAVNPAPAAGAQAEGAAAEGKAQAEADVKAAPQQPAAPLPAVAANDSPLKFVSLGSLDVNSDYRMLVTITSAGAAVHRAEMNGD